MFVVSLSNIVKVKVFKEFKSSILWMMNLFEPFNGLNSVELCVYWHINCKSFIKIKNMKNLAIIILAVLCTSTAVFAQDGTKKAEPSKKVKKETVATDSKRVRPAAPKKKEVPAEKTK